MVRTLPVVEDGTVNVVDAPPPGGVYVRVNGPTGLTAVLLPSVTVNVSGLALVPSLSYPLLVIVAT